MFTKTIMTVVILTPLASVAFGAGAVESCNYPSETKANSELILAALGNDAEQCVTFPYLASYNKPEPVMPWYHAGVDLRAKYQAAYALVDGTVVVDCGRGQKEEDTACTDSMGIVMIETEINGSKARVSYVHMSQSFVTNGMRVAAGKTKVGTTGNRFNFDPNGAGEPHLHIEVRPGYQGTSAVGFTSCQPDDRCDTKAKVQAITLDPIRLVNLQQQGTKGKDDIHHIDFRNFTYDIGKGSCADMLGKTVVQVRNGESESTNKEHPLDGASFFIYDSTVIPIIYGDLTGDKRDEAVVLTNCGEMHPEEQAFIYTMKNGRAVLLTKLEEGDRAFGGIVIGQQQCQDCRWGIKIQSGLLIVERMGGNYACCPEYIEKKVYRWDGRQLIQIGKAQRRKFISSSR